MASKRQTTLAKLDRERAVRERRARKQEKKEARRAARAAGTAPETAEVAPEDPEAALPLDDPSSLALGRDEDALELGVVDEPLHAELLADSRGLVAAEGRLGEDRAVRVDADRAGAESTSDA